MNNVSLLLSAPGRGLEGLPPIVIKPPFSSDVQAFIVACKSLAIGLEMKTRDYLVVLRQHIKSSRKR
jgi:hypothetical protein